jgi:hypothetical protein
VGPLDLPAASCRAETVISWRFQWKGWRSKNAVRVEAHGQRFAQHLFSGVQRDKEVMPWTGDARYILDVPHIPFSERAGAMVTRRVDAKKVVAVKNDGHVAPSKTKVSPVAAHTKPVDAPPLQFKQGATRHLRLIQGLLIFEVMGSNE